MLLADGGFAHTVTDGPLLVAAGVAALVGLIGFLSPCVLPLVPGYLSYVAGLSGDGDGGGDAAKPNQRRMILGSLLFVLGFTAIFVAQGVAFGSLGANIRTNNLVLQRVFGAVTILLGIVFLGGFGLFQREFKIHRLPRSGIWGAPVLGLVFGLAWTPCQTPTLGAVDSLAYTQGTAGRGAFLQVFYCLGLGLPFIVVALGFGWVATVLQFLRRHRRLISQIGGVLLIGIGVLLVTGQWNHWMDELRSSVGTSSGFDL
jgi:cytochrome c-type biogenesis protein